MLPASDVLDGLSRHGGGNVVFVFLPLPNAHAISYAFVEVFRAHCSLHSLEPHSLAHLIAHPSEGDLVMPDAPLRFSDSPASITRLPPRFGEHGREILGEIGMSGQEIEMISALNRDERTGPDPDKFDGTG